MAARHGARGAGGCAPLLMLCWLCCWPDDRSSDTSSTEKHQRKPGIAHEGTRHRLSVFARRVGSSVTSLHLPSTSGSVKEPLSSHRSHEEIRPSPRPPSDHYHSAPSVIAEVLHRRDWGSSRDLYIPLHQLDLAKELNIPGLAETSRDLCVPGQQSSRSYGRNPTSEFKDDSKEVFIPLHGREGEILLNYGEEHVPLNPDERPTRPCKKHHRNIKSTKRDKESNNDDVKDEDVTETGFYIGDHHAHTDSLRKTILQKEQKQSFNESIKVKEHPDNDTRVVDTLEDDIFFPGTESNRMHGARAAEPAGDENELDDVEIDRSGAVHHSLESRSASGYSRFIPFSPSSDGEVQEAADYSVSACYLRDRGPAESWDAETRPRLASDGDILASSHRPESGAFSESDVDLELALQLATEDRPPSYEELLYPSQGRKETAI